MCASQSTNIFLLSCFLQGFSKVIEAGLQREGSKQLPTLRKAAGTGHCCSASFPGAPALGFHLLWYILKLFNHLAKSRWGER